MGHPEQAAGALQNRDLNNLDFIHGVDNNDLNNPNNVQLHGEGDLNAAFAMHNDANNVIVDNVVIDNNVVVDDPVIVENAPNVNNDNVDPPVVDEVAANVEIVNDQVEQVGDVVVNGDLPPLFPNNVLIPRLSNGQRITLAYQYATIPARVVPEGAVADPDEVADDNQSALHTSFPVAHLVRDAFSGYVNHFERKSGKDLSESSASSDAIPASNKFQIKSGFQLAPAMDQWAFKSHYRDVPQQTEFDGDISSVRKNPDGSLPKSVNLKENEWGNLQKSASYSLRAVSHIDWYRECTKNAIDVVLQSFNPDNPADASRITALKNAKQFLRGIAYGSAQVAKMGVYQHGGVTSHLRAEFLTQEGNNILLEDKSKMFAFPYGNSLVFNGLLARVAPAVKVRHDEITSNRHLATSIKVVETMAKITDKPYAQPQSGNKNAYYNLRDNRGGRSGNRGRSSQPHYQRNSFNKQSHKQSFPGKRGRGSGDPQQSNYSGQGYKQQQQQGSANGARSKSN